MQLAKLHVIFFPVLIVVFAADANGDDKSIYF
jgi:hypothetical protein